MPTTVGAVADYLASLDENIVPPFIPGGTPKVENGVCTAAFCDVRGVVRYCERGEDKGHAWYLRNHGASTPSGTCYWQDDQYGAGSSS